MYIAKGSHTYIDTVSGQIKKTSFIFTNLDRLSSIRNYDRLFSNSFSVRTW